MAIHDRKVMYGWDKQPDCASSRGKGPSDRESGGTAFFRYWESVIWYCYKKYYYDEFVNRVV